MRRVAAGVRGGRLFCKCLVLGCLPAVLWACGASEAGDPAQVGPIRQPAIYGDDDRLDVFEHPSAELRSRAMEAAVAFMFPASLDVSDPDHIALNAPIEGNAQGLCPDERFFDQPAAAWCSGTLIDDDLVLTAGHCLGESVAQTEQTCQSVALVFNYYLQAPDELANIAVEDVFGCRQVVSWNFVDADNTAPDFAVIQLDRPAPAARVPAPLAASLPAEGDPLHIIGFPAQLPAKLESGSTVIDTDALDNFFSADTDTFVGSSGSGLYNTDIELVGVHSRGAVDWTSNGDCRVATRYDDGAEEHGYAQVYVDLLCETGWPSDRLCGAASSCGDGICSGRETSDTCDEDCRAPRCGNGVCEGTERGVCDADCGRLIETPSDWLCRPEFYGTRDGCDCECGAPDPDCEDDSQQLFGCNGTCTAEGVCIENTTTVVAPNQPGRGSSGGSCQLSPSSVPTSPVPLPWALLVMAAGLWRRRHGSSAPRLSKT